MRPSPATTIGVAAALFLAPRLAAADEEFPPKVLLWTAPLVDAAFFAVDVWALTRDRPMPVGMAAAELGVGLPQCFAGSLVFALSATEGFDSDRDWMPVAVQPSASMGCSMYVHGVFGVVDDLDESDTIAASDRFTVAALFGLNTPYSMAAVAGFLQGRWTRPDVAGQQIAVSIGTFSLSAYRAATDAPVYWTGAAWSAFNLVHGIIALAEYDGDEAPVPDYALAPTMIESNSGSAPGLALSGAW